MAVEAVESRRDVGTGSNHDEQVCMGVQFGKCVHWEYVLLNSDHAASFFFGDNFFTLPR